MLYIRHLSEPMEPHEEREEWGIIFFPNTLAHPALRLIRSSSFFFHII